MIDMFLECGKKDYGIVQIYQTVSQIYLVHAYQKLKNSRGVE